MATYSVYYDKKRLSEGKEVKALIRITQYQKHAYAETGLYLTSSQVDTDLCRCFLFFILSFLFSFFVANKIVFLLFEIKQMSVGLFIL